MIQVPSADGDTRTLVIERLDRPGERLEVKIGEDLTRGAFYDLAKAEHEAALPRGGIYRATPRRPQDHVQDRRQGQDPARSPVVSRLLRFPPG